MSIIKDMQQELLTHNGPLVKKMHTNESFRVIAIGLGSDTILKEHKADWPSKLTVLEGSVEFIQSGGTSQLTKYDTLDIEVGIPHSLHATSNSICLLTQSKPKV